MSARSALKAATAAAHDSIDALFARFELADRKGYAAFLSAQAGAFLSVEAALDPFALTLLSDWAARRRSDALRADLSDLGVTPPDPVPTPGFTGPAAALGGIYVLEGSRLGGAMLLRAVPPAFPQTFLSPGNPAAWRALVKVLDERLSSPASLAEATAAAIAVFRTFERSATRTLGTKDA